MAQLDSAFFPSLLFVVQVLGLISACLARVSRDAPQQRLFASIFMVALVAVGCSIIAAGLHRHPAVWLFGGASMGAMVMVVVWEHSAKPEDVSRH